jgi:hypothetical protein
MTASLRRDFGFAEIFIHHSGQVTNPRSTTTCVVCKDVLHMEAKEVLDVTLDSYRS